MITFFMGVLIGLAIRLINDLMDPPSPPPLVVLEIDTCVEYGRATPVEYIQPESEYPLPPNPYEL
jgi:hypothetical protein